MIDTNVDWPQHFSFISSKHPIPLLGIGGFSTRRYLDMEQGFCVFPFLLRHVL